MEVMCTQSVQTLLEYTIMPNMKMNNFKMA